MRFRNVVLACLALMLAASECAAQQLCQSVRALLQSSYSDFNSIKRNVERHSDGTSEWVPSIGVAGGQDCEGQSYPDMSSNVDCTMANSQSAEEMTALYDGLVKEIRSCLDSSFVFSEEQGGKAGRLSTPIREASFEVKGKGENPDGPRVRVSLIQLHSTRHSGYEVTVWIDGIDKE